MIKIDMEMPESCIDCRCSYAWFGESEMKYSCGITKKETGDECGRPDWCPLIEVTK